MVRFTGVKLSDLCREALADLDDMTDEIGAEYKHGIDSAPLMAALAMAAMYSRLQIRRVLDMDGRWDFHDEDLADDLARRSRDDWNSYESYEFDDARIEAAYSHRQAQLETFEYYAAEIDDPLLDREGELLTPPVSTPNIPVEASVVLDRAKRRRLSFIANRRTHRTRVAALRDKIEVAPRSTCFTRQAPVGTSRRNARKIRTAKRRYNHFLEMLEMHKIRYATRRTLIRYQRAISA